MGLVVGRWLLLVGLESREVDEVQALPVVGKRSVNPFPPILKLSELTR
jgi:hypothetical protein